MFPLSQQNENGIQAQEMWQLSQYLQVNVKQYIMFDQCVLIKSHLSCSYFNDKIQFLITFFFVWQDALYREQMLENKLANLQRLISDSKGAVEDNTQVVAYGIGVCFFRMSWWLYALHVYCNLNFEVAWTCIFAFSFSVICSRGQIAVKIRDFGKPAGNFNKGKVWSTMCSQQTFDIWTLMVKVRIFQVSLLSMWTQEN